jgi:hypothetical protein
MKRSFLLVLAFSGWINASSQLLPRAVEDARNAPGARSLPGADYSNDIQGGILPRTASATDECSDPKPNSCSFYPDCLEARLHCGPSGYPIGYGLYYCEKFSALRSQMSAAGQAWVTNTMLCLQSDLVVYGDGLQTTTCSAIKAYAFGTHADCYVKSGICTLSPTDWAKIIKTVSITELFSSLDALKATLQAVKGCLGFYVWLVGRTISKIVSRFAGVNEHTNIMQRK